MVNISFLFLGLLKRWQLKKGALPFIHPIKKIENDNIEVC